MTTSRSIYSGSMKLPLIESLENRRLLSGVLPIAPALSISTLPIAPSLPVSPTPTLPVAVSPVGLRGNFIHAEANQSFTAVIGDITGVLTPKPGYSLQGSINWGDGTATSAATFVRQANGTIAVEGSHTYAAVGNDVIAVTLTENPPAGSLLPVILVGKFIASASVISSNGGVTVSESAGVPFTAAVGSFGSTLSSLTMTATIDWGDGQSSIGKILAEPTAGPAAGGRFEVIGSHTYAQTGSYVVSVIVTSQQPVAVTAKAPSMPIIIVVAKIESIIDALPVSPSAAV